ncbi:hypothetical protein HDC37_003379 [Microbacterium sp. AK009]|uniref:hypothetical protein n=1 Tax=Microbacterium sp. AK009 TaxID=2723068 RepID=UPI0015C9DC00|nr:hypothetical protein [Microbacterium sp. AK009]NYF18515.1 hypothetical protein [Microbacterium sp. AK009]
MLLRTSCASRGYRSGGDYAFGHEQRDTGSGSGLGEGHRLVLAIGLAVLGVVLAVVSSSFLPLIMFAGLAVPMMPIGSLRPSRRVASGRH